MLQTIKDKLIWPMVIVLVGSLLTCGISWLEDYFGQPLILVDSTYYYSIINGIPVGNITVTNLGKSTDSDITVNVYDELIEGDVKTDGASEDNRVEIGKDETKFIISKLNPGDTAVVSFSPKEANSTFWFAYNSESNKIQETVYPSKFWELTGMQKLFLALIASVTFFIGFYIGRPTRKLKP